MKYKQCSLERNLKGNCVCQQVSWIPAKYAKEGAVLKLKENDVWEDGWVVIGVGSELDDKDLPDHHKAIRMHKKNTGDSLPKVS